MSENIRESVENLDENKIQSTRVFNSFLKRGNRTPAATTPHLGEQSGSPPFILIYFVKLSRFVCVCVWVGFSGGRCWKTYQKGVDTGYVGK